MRQLRRLFGIDLRNLALFRIGLGAILLIDLAIRFQDLQAHYTDAGVLPRESASDYYAGTWRWSLHQLSGELWLQAALMILAAVAAASLGLGFFTRCAAVLSWVLLVSVQTRNPLIINAGDTLLRLLLFWAMFLPLGARWSIDAWRKRHQPAALQTKQNPWFFSPATAGLLLQVAALYFMTGLYKVVEPAWQSGDGLYYALSFDAYARQPAGWLLQYPSLLRLLSYGTVALELAMPLLVFSPFATRKLRWIAVILFLGLHLGIEATLTVGLFSWVSLLAWIPLLPWTLPATEQQLQRRSGGLFSWVGATMLSLAVVLVVAWNISGFVRSRRKMIRADLPEGVADAILNTADATRIRPIRRITQGLVLFRNGICSRHRPAETDGWSRPRNWTTVRNKTCSLRRVSSPGSGQNDPLIVSPITAGASTTW